MSKPRRMRELCKLAPADPPGRVQRRELSKTVAANQVGLDAEVAQDLEQTHRHGTDGRLGDPGVAERRFLAAGQLPGKTREGDKSGR